MLFWKTNTELDSNRMIEKYLPSFRITKFSAEEGKYKVIKKLKENLEKQKIAYDDSLFNLIIPIETEPHAEQSMSKTFREISDNDLINKLGVRHIKTNFDNNEDDLLIKQFFKKVDKVPETKEYVQESKQEKVISASPIFNTNNLVVSNQDTSQKVLQNNKILQNLKNIGKNLEFFYLNDSGVKLPMYTHTYYIKSYCKDDFPDDE